MSNKLRNYLTLPLLFTAALVFGQAKTIEVKSFNEVVISPHIEVEFEESDREAVVVEDLNVSWDKLNVEVEGKTLHIYLDGAKVYTKSEKIKNDDYKNSYPLYDGTVATVKVFYRKMELASLRGDETHKFKSELQGDKFKLNIYGEPKVNIAKVHLEEFKATIYGEGYLEVKEGKIEEQKIISYGESEVNMLGVNNEISRITAYGEGRVRLAVSDELKVTAYGEASIHYKGNPQVNKGIVLGEARIHQID